MWLREFSRHLHFEVTGFLWNQWGSLGISGATATRTDKLVDPEALLVLTWTLGRASPRLFDAVYSWCFHRERDIDFKRLKHCLKDADSETRSVASAWAESLVGDGAKQWTSIRQLSSYRGEARPLFLDPTGFPQPVLNTRDPVFEKHGWLRGRLSEKAPLRDTDLRQAAMTRILLRRLVGSGVRTEVLTYALFNDTATTRRLARLTGYSQRSIQTFLADLQSLKMVSWVRTRGVSEPVRFKVRPIQEFIARISSDHAGKSHVLGDVRWFDMLNLARSIPDAWNVARQSLNVSSESGQHQIMWELATILSALGDTEPFETTVREREYSHWTLDELRLHLSELIAIAFDGADE